MTNARPPRIADWILRRSLPSGVRGDSIRGDLIEEFRAHPSAPWYWRQTLSVALRHGWHRDRARPKGEDHMRLESIWQDVRYAVRSYGRTPSFTLAVLTTLALGIGASTAIFSMVDGILLRPLPLDDPDTLVYANEVNRQGQQISTSWLNYLDWRQRARSFEQLALSRDEPQTLSGVDRPARLRARRVTAN